MSGWMNRRHQGKAYEPTDIEHLANIFTHGLMVPVSPLASSYLVQKASSMSHQIVALIYGTNLTFLFATSAVFHATFYLNMDAELVNQLRKADRAVIYIFIASCYAPWLTLLPFPEDHISAQMSWIMYILAFLGVLFELTLSKKYPLLAIACYVIYGVLPAIYLDYQMNFPGITELKMSGALYLIGVIFFRCDGIIPFAHAIWHLCVILGASVHYFAVVEHFYSGSKLEVVMKSRDEF